MKCSRKRWWEESQKIRKILRKPDLGRTKTPQIDAQYKDESTKILCKWTRIIKANLGGGDTEDGHI